MQKGHFYDVKGLSLHGKRTAFTLRFDGNLEAWGGILQNKTKREIGKLLIFSDLENTQKSPEISHGRLRLQIFNSRGFKRKAFKVFLLHFDLDVKFLWHF